MLVRPSKTPARPAKKVTEPARTLAQEKVDFTAEGSPPPGQVAGVAPSLPEDDELPARPETTSKPAARARSQPPSPGGPARRPSKRNPAAWRGNG